MKLEKKKNCVHFNSFSGHPIAYENKYSFVGKIIKYVKKAGFWAIGGIFRPKNRSDNLFSKQYFNGL